MTVGGFQKIGNHLLTQVAEAGGEHLRRVGEAKREK
jgi:hypothetical protein